MKLWSGCGFCWGCFSHFLRPSADEDLWVWPVITPPNILGAVGLSPVTPHLCIPQVPPVVPHFSVPQVLSCEMQLFALYFDIVLVEEGCVSNTMFNADGLLQWFCHIPNCSDHEVITWRDGPCCSLKKGHWRSWFGAIFKVLFWGTLGFAPNPPYLLWQHVGILCTGTSFACSPHNRNSYPHPGT